MAPFRIHNHLGPYISFWANVASPSQERWRKEVEAPFPHIYSEIIPEYGYQSTPAVPPVSTNELMVTSDKMIAIVHEQMARLANFFDLDQEIGDIYLVPLNCTAPSLTGCWTNFQIAPMCIVGFDGFFEDLDYFSVVCAHEMTHAVHMHFNHPGPTANQTGTFAQCLWNEGLAEFTSLKLNPEYPIERALRGGLAKFSFEQLKPYFRKYAEILEEQLQEETFPLHQKWFGFGGIHEDLDIPAAAGYIMGYRSIERLTREFSVRELASMPRPTYTKHLRRIYSEQ